MNTAEVNHHGRIITLNEKFIPGLVAAAIIYWCDSHGAYHLRDDYEGAHTGPGDLALIIVEEAAKHNDAPAWADGQPLNPRAF